MPILLYGWEVLPLNKSTYKSLDFVINHFHEAFRGGAEIARPDIARLDNTAPHRKGGHRKTCISVRVDAHYKFVFYSGSIT